MRQVTEGISVWKEADETGNRGYLHKTTRKEANETGNRGYAQDNQKGS